MGPIDPKSSACTRTISALSSSPRNGRCDRGRRFASQEADGADCSALQIGSTPNTLQ